MLGTGAPQFRVWPVDQSIVGNNPFTVKRAESIPHRRYACALLLCNGQRVPRIARQAILHDTVYVPIAKFSLCKVRMEEVFLLRSVCRYELYPAPLKRLNVRRDNPGAPGHHPRSVIDE